MAELIDRLREIGLTEWEAKVYVALLDEAPMSGYGVAKRSGVPRSRVYDVLASLVTKGAVYTARTNPSQYGPVPPGELVDRYRRHYTRLLDEVENAAEQHVAQVGGNELIWDLQGRSVILERARHLVAEARRRILLEVWAPDAAELRADLAAASDRGVQVTAVAYGDPEFPFARVYAHPLTDQVTSGLGGRWLVISADDREIVAGIVSSGTLSRAAWTSHPGLAVPITELIKHDIYKLEMLAAERAALEARFGPGLIRLREQLRDPGEPDLPAGRSEA